jgi:hypothetical protein
MAAEPVDQGLSYFPIDYAICGNAEFFSRGRSFQKHLAIAGSGAAQGGYSPGASGKHLQYV